MKEFSALTILEIASATDYNDHNEAVLLACEEVGAADLAGTMRVIKMAYDQIGSMSDDMMNLRRSTYKSLVAVLQSDYKNADMVIAAF